MNTEEKAKAYDEALEQAKKELRTDLHESGVWALKRIFPELADSEDERIRKEIIDYLGLVGKGKGDYAQPMIDRWIAYLEKQKEQQPIIQDVELNDAVYDYVRDHFIAGADFTPEYIKKLMENAFFAGVDYYLLKQESESCEPDTNVEKVIEDVIRVYGKTQGKWVGGYDVDTLIVNLRRAFNKKEQKPVKIDEDIELGLDRALQIIKEAKGVLKGYQSDDGIYECDHAIRTLTHILKNGIEQKPVHTAKEMWKEMRLEVYAQASGNRHEPNYSDDSTKMFSLCDIDEIFEKIGNSTVGSQPAEWSEEDETMLRTIISDGSRGVELDSKQISWLKSLPERFNLEPKQEWSEEDVRILKGIIGLIDHDQHYGVSNNEMISWLKSHCTAKDCSSCAKHLEDYISGRSDAENKLLEQFGALITPEDELHIKPRWKPSEEQILAIVEALKYLPNNKDEWMILNTLIDFLKKLM